MAYIIVIGDQIVPGVMMCKGSIILSQRGSKWHLSAVSHAHFKVKT